MVLHGSGATGAVTSGGSAAHGIGTAVHVTAGALKHTGGEGITVIGDDPNALPNEVPPAGG